MPGLSDPPDTYQPTFSNHHSAGYGVVSGCDLGSNQINALDSCFFDVDLRGMELAYNDAFVEVYGPREGMSVVPYLSGWFFNGASGAPTSTRAFFSQTWFAHWVPYPGFPLRCLPNDYFHFVGASGSAIAYGLTLHVSNVTYDLIDAIAGTFGTGGPFSNACQAVTSHELGHQFVVNPCQCDFHDDRNAWCASLDNCANPGITHTITCLMNVTDHYFDNLADGVDRFGVQDLWVGTYGCNGKQCSPQDWRSYPPGFGAIRTMPDPQ